MIYSVSLASLWMGKLEFADNISTSESCGSTGQPSGHGFILHRSEIEKLT